MSEGYADRLRTLQEAQEWTPEQASSAFSVSRYTWDNWLAGRTTPLRVYIVKLEQYERKAKT